MCYFKTLDVGSIKLQGVQAAVLGKGATEWPRSSRPLALSCLSQHKFFLGTAFTFWSNLLRTPDQKQLGSPHPGKTFVFSICRNVTFLGQAFTWALEEYSQQQIFQLLKILVAVLGQIFPFAPQICLWIWETNAHLHRVSGLTNWSLLTTKEVL